MQIDSTACNSNQTWNNKTCQCECKNYCTCKEDYSWNPGICICEDSKYLKGNNFRGFRGFLPNPRKLIPAKNLFCLKLRKLVPAKLVKNFDPQK